MENWRNAQPFEEGAEGFEGSGLGVRSRTVGSSPEFSKRRFSTRERKGRRQGEREEELPQGSKCFAISSEVIL